MYFLCVYLDKWSGETNKKKYNRGSNLSPLYPKSKKNGRVFNRSFILFKNREITPAYSGAHVNELH